MNPIQFEIPSVTPLNAVDFGLNLAICILASFVLRYVYIRKSISLSGKYHIGSVIPLLAVITFRNLSTTLRHLSSFSEQRLLLLFCYQEG